MEMVQKVLLIVVGLFIATHCAVFDESKGEVLRVTKNGFEKCKDIDIKKLHIKGKACIVISYTESEMGLEVNITWNGKGVFHTKITAKQTPAICFKLPALKGIEACLKLTDISFKPLHHGACLQLTLKALTFKKTFKLGCIYKMPRKTGTILIDGYKTKETGVLVGGWYEPRSEKIVKTGYYESGWTEATEKVTKLHESIISSMSDPDPPGKCTCQKPRKCMCCNTIPKTQTKVCGRPVCSKKGKVFWLGLYVNMNKSFKVSSPVGRLFTMVCGDPRVGNITTSICLQLSKVQQTQEQISACITAHIIVKTPHVHVDLGCFTLKHQKTCAERDEKVRFLPRRVRESDPYLL